ncbi:hypothetical protein F7725_004630 [Dissostichus mawsoni]|uniref:HDAg domain-containing protein n=1 Tax=Dissostichus mawsoni TaxID=36200 RepID=A0A7J5XJA7_DISMA|nr:hypothetical protein F7725_004630 [Dissostichus mawsoni]
MASMKDSDTGLWLHNKLGSTDELWTPPSIASLLTVSVIDNIRLCFSSLSPPVKLKLLLGMLHLPGGPWTRHPQVLPRDRSLNLDLEEQNPNVQDILGELREKVGECEASNMLPLECQYLNKSALTTLVGPLTPPVKHFQLKRKPKSATLRAELLQKSIETAQQLKKTAGVPFHAKGRGLVKKIDTTSELNINENSFSASKKNSSQGIPNKAHSAVPRPPVCSARPVTARLSPRHGRLCARRGGQGNVRFQKTLLDKTQLLDISELDMVGAGREAKRRRKTLETEAGEKAAKEEAAAAAVVENTTPDYAAGLVSAQKLGALTENPLPSTSYLPATPSMVPSSSYIPSSEAQPANAGGSGRDTLQSARQPEESATAGAGATATLPGQYKQRTPMYNASNTTNPATPTSPSTPVSTPASNGPPAAATASQPETPTQPPSTPQTPTPTPTPTPPQPQPKKNLSLTRDQMYAAQEMFKTANKVTRPEKALILGFMAGSRENPCPEQGDIIQIKLSEHTEVLPKADGTGSTTMLVDTVFEMNYSTGQWTRLKKYKPITNTS